MVLETSCCKRSESILFFSLWVALVCYFSVRSNFFLQEMCIEGLLCAKICSKTIEGVATFPEVSFMEHESYKAHSP